MENAHIENLEHPEIEFLDRLIDAGWGDVPREMMPDCVLESAKAGTPVAAPSPQIKNCASRRPGLLSKFKWERARTGDATPPEHWRTADRTAGSL